LHKLPVMRAEELETQHVELLPARETMAACYFACTTVVNVIGVNLAIAINAASINASANATATQALGVWAP
jgi:hypothetical protein